MVISLYSVVFTWKKGIRKEDGTLLVENKKIKKLAAGDGSKSDLKILSENGRHVHSIADGLGDISSGCKIQ